MMSTQTINTTPNMDDLSLEPSKPVHSGHIGVLSDRDLRREIAAGNLVLYDPDRDCSGNIQNCSIDITLGPYYFRNENPIIVMNPWCAKHVREYWGTVKEASIVTAAEVESGFADVLAVKEGDKYIWLEPNESILAHTREFIGGANHITTMIKARSSMGRCRMTVCDDSGWGDINYYSRWTLEIQNKSTSPVVLPVGARIGQVVFFYTGVPDTVYKGKYQSTSNLQELVKNWAPDNMLPKAYMDKK